MGMRVWVLTHLPRQFQRPKAASDGDRLMTVGMDDGGGKTTGDTVLPAWHRSSPTAPVIRAGGSPYPSCGWWFPDRRGRSRVGASWHWPQADRRRRVRSFGRSWDRLHGRSEREYGSCGTSWVRRWPHATITGVNTGRRTCPGAYSCFPHTSYDAIADTLDVEPETPPRILEVMLARRAEGITD